MKATRYKGLKRVINKKYWNSQIRVLSKIEDEQNEYLAFSYLLKITIPNYLKELGFEYSNEYRTYNSNGITINIAEEDGYADLSFYSENASKNLGITGCLLRPSVISSITSYKEKIAEKKVLGDLSTLASEILISIRDVWNLSNQNLCFSTLERKHYVNKNRKWEESSH